MAPLRIVYMGPDGPCPRMCDGPSAPYNYAEQPTVAVLRAEGDYLTLVYGAENFYRRIYVTGEVFHCESLQMMPGFPGEPRLRPTHWVQDPSLVALWAYLVHEDLLAAWRVGRDVP